MHTYLYDIYISLEASLQTEQILFEQFFHQIANKTVNRQKINNKINITIDDKIAVFHRFKCFLNSFAQLKTKLDIRSLLHSDFTTDWHVGRL